MGRRSAHRLGVVLTIPASAALAALAALLVKAGPLTTSLAILVAGALALVLLARRTQRKQPIVDPGITAPDGPNPVRKRVIGKAGPASSDGEVSAPQAMRDSDRR